MKWKKVFPVILFIIGAGIMLYSGNVGQPHITTIGAVAAIIGMAIIINWNAGRSRDNDKQNK